MTQQRSHLASSRRSIAAAGDGDGESISGQARFFNKHCHRIGLRRPHPAQRSLRLRSGLRADFPKIWGRKLCYGDINRTKANTMPASLG